MKNQKALCELRTHRRTWGLTQPELVKLLGRGDAAHLYKIETGERYPTIEFALGCQALFGVPVDTVFPNLYEEIEEGILRRIARFHEHILESPPPRTRKKELLDSALKRAISRLKPQGV